MGSLGKKFNVESDYSCFTTMKWFLSRKTCPIPDVPLISKYIIARSSLIYPKLDKTYIALPSKTCLHNRLPYVALAFEKRSQDASNLYKFFIQLLGQLSLERPATDPLLSSKQFLGSPTNTFLLNEMQRRNFVLLES